MRKNINLLESRVVGSRWRRAFAANDVPPIGSKAAKFQLSLRRKPVTFCRCVGKRLGATVAIGENC
jgi:hypothetical protein